MKIFHEELAKEKGLYFCARGFVLLTLSVRLVGNKEAQIV